MRKSNSPQQMSLLSCTSRLCLIVPQIDVHSLSTIGKRLDRHGKQRLAVCLHISWRQLAQSKLLGSGGLGRCGGLAEEKP